MAKGYRKYSPEFCEEVAKVVVDTSWAITDVAREYGVRDTTLGNWARDYKEKHGGETEAPLPFPSAPGSASWHGRTGTFR